MPYNIGVATCLAHGVQLDYGVTPPRWLHSNPMSCSHFVCLKNLLCIKNVVCIDKPPNFGYGVIL